MGDNITFASATELAHRIRRRDLSPVEVVDAFASRIESHNNDINAYTQLRLDEAQEEAKEAERALEEGDSVGALHGVPYALKELFGFKEGLTNSFGSVPLADFVPDYSIPIVKRLEGAGAICLGTTNVPEFGHKGITDNLLFGPTSTPFDHNRNAGGSSGGAAAAVGYGLAPIAQGADGGGSIRIPSSFSGVYGIKPSYGRVPLDIRPDAFSSQPPFINQGPHARTVEDAALMLDVIAGPHPNDPFSLPEEDTEYVAAARRSIDEWDIAYSPDFGDFPIDERVRDVVEDAVPAFEEAGATVDEVEIDFGHPHDELCQLWMREMGVLYAEMAANFKEGGVVDFDEHRDELTPEFAELIDIGNSLDAVEFKQDDIVRTDVFKEIQSVLKEYDLIVSPTLAVPPVENDDDGNTVGPSEVAGEEVDPLLGWCLTYPINYTGHPSASVPAGFTDEGLPVGMQLIGRRFADDDVLAASGAFERVRPWQHAYDDLR